MIRSQVTRLPSSNHWKPVCTQMKLKDQKEESGLQGEDKKINSNLV